MKGKQSDLVLLISAR